MSSSIPPPPFQDSQDVILHFNPEFILPTNSTDQQLKSLQINNNVEGKKKSDNKSTTANGIETSNSNNNSSNNNEEEDQKTYPNGRKRASKACFECQKRHTRCGFGRPCERCKRLGLQCVDVPSAKKRGRTQTKNSKKEESSSPTTTTSENKRKSSTSSTPNTRKKKKDVTKEEDYKVTSNKDNDTHVISTSPRPLLFSENNKKEGILSSLLDKNKLQQTVNNNSLFIPDHDDILLEPLDEHVFLMGQHEHVVASSNLPIKDEYDLPPALFDERAFQSGHSHMLPTVTTHYHHSNQQQHNNSVGGQQHVGHVVNHQYNSNGNNSYTYLLNEPTPVVLSSNNMPNVNLDNQPSTTIMNGNTTSNQPQQQQSIELMSYSILCGNPLDKSINPDRMGVILSKELPSIDFVSESILKRLGFNELRSLFDLFTTEFIGSELLTLKDQKDKRLQIINTIQGGDEILRAHHLRIEKQGKASVWNRKGFVESGGNNNIQQELLDYKSFYVYNAEFPANLDCIYLFLFW
ncbi:hypothetical protein ABK040_002990 [Willaertia magna]